MFVSSLFTACKIAYSLSICCLKLLQPSEIVCGFRCWKKKVGRRNQLDRLHLQIIAQR